RKAIGALGQTCVVVGLISANHPWASAQGQSQVVAVAFKDKNLRFPRRMASLSALLLGMTANLKGNS
ncbi:MAG TPA: hypothetical protein VII99_13040, partial [Bacteroidia bacterium]